MIRQKLESSTVLDLVDHSQRDRGRGLAENWAGGLMLDKVRQAKTKEKMVLWNREFL